MREILFRGKTEKGEWLYGGYVKCNNREYILPDIDLVGREWVFKHIEIIPETVGQFTGLTDKNGKKIFEGDIVKFLDKDWKAGGIATVDYEYGKWKINGQYATEISSTVWLDLYRNDFEYEVIGNIHDTPELLGE